MERHVLLTGPPGVGKTTLAKKVSEILSKENSVSGFYTEEVRTAAGIRHGFDVVLINGQSRYSLHKFALLGPLSGIP